MDTQIGNWQVGGVLGPFLNPQLVQPTPTIRSLLRLRSFRFPLLSPQMPKVDSLQLKSFAVFPSISCPTNACSHREIVRVLGLQEALKKKFSRLDALACCQPQKPNASRC